MNGVICEGCGRAPGARDVYCTACGRQLPGREVPAAGGDAAPPGWLVAAGARGDTGLFEPLPSFMRAAAAPAEEAPAESTAVLPMERELAGEPAVLPAPVEGGPGWRVRETSRAPIPLPLPLRTAAEASPAADGPSGDALVLAAPRPRLHVLYAPLVALVILSSCGAVALLVLHVLLHR